MPEISNYILDYLNFENDFNCIVGKQWLSISRDIAFFQGLIDTKSIKAPIILVRVKSMMTVLGKKYAGLGRVPHGKDNSRTNMPIT